MQERIKSITEGTLVPLSLVITLAGGMFFVSTIYTKTESHGEALDHLSTTLETINQRLSHIEGFLERSDKK